MRIDHIIWGTTGVIVTIALATQTNILKNLANRVGSRGQVGFGYGPSCGRGFQPLMQEQYPSEILNEYNPDFDYQGTESEPRAVQDQLDEQQQQPNYTKPLVNPEQARKNTKYHQKHKQNKQEQQVYTQIECPDDPNTLPCGSNCYHDGKLWKTVCDEQQEQSLFPPPTQQNNIHPTTPQQNYLDFCSQYPEYCRSQQQQQQRRPTTPQTTTAGTLYPVVWDHNYGGSGPCKDGNLSHGLKRDTCRLQANLEDLYNQDYAIDASATIGSFSQGSDHHGGDCTETGNATKGFKGKGKGSCGPRLEIASGGPGSGGGQSCCGFTIAINNTDGTMRMEQEGPGNSTGKVFCDDSSHEHAPACTQKSNSVTGGQPTYGKTLGIQWVKQGSQYGGAISGPSGRIPAQGYTWAPGNPIIGKFGGPGGNDSTRVRVDSAGLSPPFNGDPKVYILPISLINGALISVKKSRNGMGRGEASVRLGKESF